MHHSFRATHFLRERASAQGWVNEVQRGAVMSCTIFACCSGAIQGFCFVPRKLSLSRQAMQAVVVVAGVALVGRLCC